MKSVSTLLFIITTLSFIIVFVFVNPISQNLSYHQFIDSKQFFGVNNFYNVVSNIGFCIVGLLGLFQTNRDKYLTVLSIGFFFTGLGSAYYHYIPNYNTLVWDRLPMTIVFTTFFAQVYSWYLDKNVANKIWILSLILGALSVWYWKYTESLGKGDLRLYALVQYLPMLLLVVIISLNYKKNKQITQTIILIGVFYFLAKLFENYDEQIFHLTHIIGGHPLKHIVASVAAYYIILLHKRKKFLKRHSLFLSS